MFRQPGIYNLTRTIRSILKRYRKESPSLTMHLYSAGFRLGAKDSALHAYDGEMKHWMDCIREQKMPNELLDVLDELGIRFYDGCLIVEVHDHRSAQQQPEQQAHSTADHHHHQSTTTNSQQLPTAAHQRASNNLLHQSSNSHQPSTSTDLPNDQVSVHRLVLTPTCETLWRDILLMNEAKLAQLNRGTKGTSSSSSSSEFKWGPITEEEAVELEAAILDRTAPALCLSPSIITSRIANQMLSETSLQPSTDKKKSRKRPLNSGEKEAMRRQRERQERYMHIADESYDQSFAPTFSRIDLIKRLRTTRPVITAPQEPEKKWNARNPNQDALKGFIPHMTVAPSDLHLPGYSLHDPKNESQQATKPVAGSSSHQPSNSGRPSTPPPASAAPSATIVPAPAPAPTGKKTASKKKAVERSETGSPAAGSLAPLKKPPKKPKKQVELTPEAAALAEEKRKKQAEQRKIQKERKLALAAAAKAEAAQKAAAAASSSNSAPTPSNRETSTAATPPAPENSIPVPNRDQNRDHPANQSTEYHHHQQADISISVPDSIPVVTGDSIPVPNQFTSNSHLNTNIPVPNLSNLSNHTSPAPNNGIPVHQEVNVNSSSIPVPAFNHSIPVPSPSHHNSIPVHQGIPVGNELLPRSAHDSIAVPSPGNDINCFPVPNHAHHPTMDQLASIPVPQSEPQLWNPAFTNFRPPSVPNHLHQRAPDIDIDVHLRPSQPPAIPSLASIEVPNIPIHPHALHQPILTQQEHQQQQQQQYHHQQQVHQQHQQQHQHQQHQQQQQTFHN